MASKIANVVLVTGANQGIGFEISRALGARSGYHILMGSRDASKGTTAAKTLSGEGLSVESIQVDVTDDESITRAAADDDNKFGRLDVLINNAGITNDGSLGQKGRTMRQVLQEGYNTNVFGPAQLTETFLPLILKSTDPRILFTSSTLGSMSSAASKKPSEFVALPMYNSSKSALNMISLYYAKTLDAKGVKVNVFCPGFVSTNLNGFNDNARPASDGAINAVRLVTESKETATFTRKDGPVPW